MGKKIRLYVIGPRGFPGVQGGIERFSENLYPRLAESGYEVVCFSISRYSPIKNWRKIRFVQVPTPKLKNLEKTIYNLCATIYCIVKKPDIVHIHSIASGSLIFLLKLFRIKVIARYNSRDYLHGKWSRFGKSVLKFSERQFFLSDYIVTNNKTYLEFLISQGRKSNISYLPNGIDQPNIALFRREAKRIFPEISNKKFILSVGRITAEKNVEFLIQSFLNLQRRNLLLVIVGDSAHGDRYLHDLKVRYANDNILFLGKRNRHEISCLYATSSLFVMPSLHEGMPNVLLEAMSFNCKILASRIPAHLQFQFEDDIYFHPTVSEDLQQKIAQKVDSDKFPDYRDKLRAHDWSCITEQVHQMHLKVLAKDR